MLKIENENIILNKKIMGNDFEIKISISEDNISIGPEVFNYSKTPSEDIIKHIRENLIEMLSYYNNTPGEFSQNNTRNINYFYKKDSGLPLKIYFFYNNVLNYFCFYIDNNGKFVISEVLPQDSYIFDNINTILLKFKNIHLDKNYKKILQDLIEDTI